MKYSSDGNDSQDRGTIHQSNDYVFTTRTGTPLHAPHIGPWLFEAGSGQSRTRATPMARPSALVAQPHTASDVLFTQHLPRTGDALTSVEQDL